MPFEKPGSENRSDREEGVYDDAPVLTAQKNKETDQSIFPGDEKQERDRAESMPKALITPEQEEPTAEETLAAQLGEARRAYAAVLLHEEQMPDEEKERVIREYRGAVSAMRRYRREQFAADESWTPAETAEYLEKLILSFTADEKTRLIRAKDEAKIKERDAAAASSLPRYILEDYREALSIFGRGTRNVAEWYRSIPPRYKIAVGAVLFGATAGGAYLGLPLLVAAGGSARLATRLLGGGSGALGAEGGMQWWQERKARREIFGIGQEKTWNPNVKFSWNPLQMAVGMFRREATAEQSQKWAEQLTAIIANDDDTRLNDAIIKQAGRDAGERHTRAIVAGIVFTAIAAGMPGKGFRYIGEQTGVADAIRRKAQEWTHDILHGGTAEAASAQTTTPGAAAPHETFIQKLQRNPFLQKITGVHEPAQAPVESGPDKSRIKPTHGGPLTTEQQTDIQKKIDTTNKMIARRLKALENPMTDPGRQAVLLGELETLKKELTLLDQELQSDQSAPNIAKSEAGRTAKTPPSPAAETTPPHEKLTRTGKKLSEVIQTNIRDQNAWERIIKDELGLEKQALIEQAQRDYLYRSPDSPEIGEQWAQKNWPEEMRIILERHIQGDTSSFEQAVHRSDELRLPSDPAQLTTEHKAVITRGIAEHTAKIKFLTETAFDSTATRAARWEIMEHKKIIEDLEAKLKPTPPAPAPAQGAPILKQEVAPQAQSVTPSGIEKLATVHKGEGAWQAVRRQMYARLYDDIQKEPARYKLTHAEAAKLPHDFEHPPKTGTVAKILDRETLVILKRAGYINPDGTTHVGMRPGAHVVLTPDDKIDIGGRGESIYEFDKSHKGGAGHPIDETRPSRGRAGVGRTYQDYVNGENRPRYAANQFLADTTPEEPITHEEYAASPAGQAAAEQAQALQLKTNLRESGVTPKEFQRVERIRTDRFIKSIDRDAPGIREWRDAGSRANMSFRITDGNLTARGVNVSGKEAGKYLDLTEQLNKHFRSVGYREHKRLLRRPLGEVLRAIKLK